MPSIVQAEHWSDDFGTFAATVTMFRIALMDAMNELSQHKEIPLKRVPQGWSDRDAQSRILTYWKTAVSKKPEKRPAYDFVM